MDGLFSPVQLTVVSPGVPRLPQCRMCGLDKTCRTPKVPPSGSGRAKILVVSEFPGAEEDARGVQLVGSSGQRLVSGFRRAGVDVKRDCWLTHAAICHPPDNKLPDAAVDHCRPNLVKAVEDLRPTVIVTIGEPALRSVLGAVWKERKETLAKWVGWRIPLQKWNCWVCPTWHPAYLVREKSPVLDRLFDQHLAQAAALADTPPWDDTPDLKSKVRVLMDPGEVTRAIIHLAQTSKVIAFDYETDRLKPDHPDARVVSCAVSNGKFTIAYPWVGYLPSLTYKHLLRDPNIAKFGWNMKFEERWTRRQFGAGVRGWLFDGMTAAHVLDNRPDIVSLKFQAFALLGEEDYSTAIKPYLRPKTGGGNDPNRVTELPLNDLLTYNGLDALLEYKLCRKLWKATQANY